MGKSQCVDAGYALRRFVRGKRRCVRRTGGGAGTGRLCDGRRRAVRCTRVWGTWEYGGMVFVWCGWYCLHAAYCTCMVHTDSLMRGLEGLTRRKHRTH